MRDVLFIAELCIAGLGQQVVVSCHDAEDISVPVFLVDPEFYDESLESAE